MGCIENQHQWIKDGERFVCSECGVDFQEVLDAAYESLRQPIAPRRPWQPREPALPRRAWSRGNRR